MKILMVCLGNICRSPIAEGILKKKNKQHLFTLIESAGTADYHVGKNPDKRAIEIAKQNNIDIEKYTARQFKQADFKKYDIIYAMDQNNYQNLKKLATNIKEEEKIKLILNEIEPNSNKSVPDPYYGHKDGFEIIFKLLNNACDKLIENIE
ncbi:MAG: protein-tyrosine-phosphatase [Flavobacteriales bacterium]|nr:protein-tyrosine-phosphatase [Flavobacteriales bacterium]|tara:strand:- start:58412 stop:58864 length:453 start_codon:yes stop_codon:yes gene_type:complete